MGILDTSDVGPGVNGHSWFEIAQHCAAHKDRIYRDKDREFIDSIYRADSLSRQIPIATAGKMAARYLQSAFWREDRLMQPIIEVRFAMVTNGYTSIVPVIGKKPVLDQWQKTENVSRKMLEDWSRNCPSANNTGILTKLVPTLDLDLLQENAAIAAENLVRERFDGLGSILRRIGRPPKRAILFRTKDPFKKLTTLFTATNGADPEKIEFLADGQQVVAHGIHPDTQTEYLWDRRRSDHDRL